MNLKDSFPSLSLFSDIDWSKVADEFKISSQIMTFPEYLEMKAEEGDCPPYLFELAYFEEALTTLQNAEFYFPEESGIFLNPAACFLTLEFDVVKMLSLAQLGKIEVVARPHVLCVYVDRDGEIQFTDLAEDEVRLLTLVEEGVVVPPEDESSLKKLQRVGLILING